MNDKYVSDVCYGCSACFSICPKNAIVFEDSMQKGYIARIRGELCINCGKCNSVCPSLNILKKEKSIERVYAVKANDEIRRCASSGGAFSVMSEYALLNDYCVYGVSYTDDWGAEHIRIENVNDLHMIQGSKYFQATPNHIFKKVKYDLERDKKVLFSGCPCQIDGLYAYLGELGVSENFVTVDLLCYGAPSDMVWKRYIEELNIKDRLEREIFRDKEYGWSCKGHTFFLSDKSTLRMTDNDAYQVGFHSKLTRREVCNNCKYNSKKRIGDITLGDFWGIDKWKREMVDNLGISAVMINTRKGKDFFYEVKKMYKECKRFPNRYLLQTENRINERNGVGEPNSELFWLKSKNESFAKSIREAYSGIHDIGMVCLLNHNYGNNMTNYALYTYLNKLGYSVRVIFQNKETGFCVYDENKILSLFDKKPFKNCDFDSKYDTSVERYRYNDSCRMFLLGSDQCLRSIFAEPMRFHSLMDWVKDGKYKAAYSASFGVNQFEGNEIITRKYKALLTRFNRISVREKSGLDILQNHFGIEGKYVVDPVFLLSAEDYSSFIGFDSSGEECYTASYVLDYSEKRENLIRKIAKKFSDGNIRNIGDAIDDNRTYKWTIPTITLPSNEQWLKNIRDCACFATDSFHGICFAIIFRKQFWIVYDKWQWRGEERINSLLEALSIKDRWIHENDNLDDLVNKAYINYDEVYKKLNVFIESSELWLKETIINGLNQENKVCTPYNMLLDVIYADNNECAERMGFLAMLKRKLLKR